jgi:hypothetical protein
MAQPIRTLLTIVTMTAGLVAACDDDKKKKTSSGGGTKAPAAAAPSLSRVTLDAYTDFRCTSNWGDRDGAWGLAAYSGNGSCKASFPGAAGTYQVAVVIQTERDGSPGYRVSINGKTVASGSYPYATGKAACDCSLDDCPDRTTVLDAGTHRLKTGDVLEFWGSDHYPCGKDHGAYAKWHRMEITPAG